jgi:hypothetical protein
MCNCLSEYDAPMRRLLAFAVLALLLVPATASARTVTRVYCAEKGPLVKPNACEFYSRPGIAGTYVTGLRWRNWGTAKATATGTFRGNMNYTSRVQVQLSKPQLCQVGQPRQRVYTAAKFKFKGESKWLGGPIVSCEGT